MYFFTLKFDHHNVLVADVAPGTTIPECLDDLFHHQQDELDSYNLLVLRPPVAQQISNISEIVEQLYASAPRRVPARDPFSRFPGTPVHILYSSNYRCALSDNINMSAPPIDVDTERLLPEICQQELDGLVAQGCALFPEISGYSYETPSGKHVKSFLRAGNIQTSRGALDGIFFWLLPHFRDRNSILIDTWSIGSTALNVARRIVDYDPGRPPPAVEIISGYSSTPEERAKDLSRRIARLRAATGTAADFKLLVILSAQSSGSLYASLQERLRDVSEEVRFVALFRLQHRDDSPDCLRDYSDQAHFAQAESPTTPIRVDPRAFFILRQIDVPLKIYTPSKPENNFVPFALSVSPSNRRGLVQVHKNYNRPGQERHHGIWIDTDALIRDKLFKEKYFEKLSKLPRPKVIATPGHEAGKQLAQLATEKFELGPDVVIHHPNLTPGIQPEAALSRVKGLGADDSLLLIDDAFISGNQLATFQKGLRELEVACAVNYICAVARPASINDWNEAVSDWKWQSNTGDYVDLIVLPNWHESNCPWCLEARRIPKLLKEFDFAEVNAVFVNRQALLNEGPLHSDKTFLCRNPDGGRLGFGKDSVFAYKSDDDPWVFASVASHIQQMRNGVNPKQLHRLARPQGPLCTMLKYEEYLERKYTDSLLRAAIIRASQSYELVYSDAKDEKLRTERAAELIRSPVNLDGDLGLELLIAAACDKFPLMGSHKSSIGPAFSGGGRSAKWLPYVTVRNYRRLKLWMRRLRKLM